MIAIEKLNGALVMPDPISPRCKSQLPESPSIWEGQPNPSCSFIFDQFHLQRSKEVSAPILHTNTYFNQQQLMRASIAESTGSRSKTIHPRIQETGIQYRYENSSSQRKENDHDHRNSQINTHGNEEQRPLDQYGMSSQLCISNQQAQNIELQHHDDHDDKIIEFKTEGSMLGY